MGFELKDEKLQEALKEMIAHPDKYQYIELPSVEISFNPKEPFWLAELKCAISRKMFWRYLKYKITGR